MQPVLTAKGSSRSRYADKQSATATLSRKPASKDDGLVTSLVGVACLLLLGAGVAIPVTYVAARQEGRDSVVTLGPTAENSGFSVGSSDGSSDGSLGDENARLRRLQEQYSEIQRPRRALLRRSLDVSKRVDWIVARYREETEWIRDLLIELPTTRVYLYQKEGVSLPPICSDATAGDVRCTSIANVGRESFAYLTHLVDRYHDSDVPSKLVFSQATKPTPSYVHEAHYGGHMSPDADFVYDFLSPYTNPVVVPTFWRGVYGAEMAVRRDYVTPWIAANNSMASEASPNPCPFVATDNSAWNAWNDTANPWVGKLAMQPGQAATTLEFWNRYFAKDLGNYTSERYLFANGATFSMDPKVWKERPIEFYKNLKATVDHHPDPVAGYHLEHLWGYVAGHKSLLDDCAGRGV